MLWRNFYPEAIMCCSAWLNRGTTIGLLIGALLGIGAAALWFETRNRPKELAIAEKPKPDVPAPKDSKPQNPKTELAMQVAPAPREAKSPGKSDDAKKAQAALGCRSLHIAIDAYFLSATNPGLSDEDRLPASIGDLVTPPFGGTSFLKNGKDDTIDPWGKQYKFTLAQRGDGMPYITVSTTAPDGTPISQSGIGGESRPKQ